MRRSGRAVRLRQKGGGDRRRIATEEVQHEIDERTLAVRRSPDQQEELLFTCETGDQVAEQTDDVAAQIIAIGALINRSTKAN